METVSDALKALKKPLHMWWQLALESVVKRLSTSCGNSKEKASLIKLVTPGFWLAKVNPGNRRAASKI